MSPKLLKKQAARAEREARKPRPVYEAPVDAPPVECDQDTPGKISIFCINPDGSTSTAENYTLRNLQKMAKGNIGELPIFKSKLASKGIYAYINDSFLINGMEHNRIASQLAGFRVCGPALFVNADEGAPLTDAHIKMLKAL